MSQICPRGVLDISQICPKYIPDMYPPLRKVGCLGHLQRPDSAQPSVATDQPTNQPCQYSASSDFPINGLTWGYLEFGNLSAT